MEWKKDLETGTETSREPGVKELEMNSICAVERGGPWSGIERNKRGGRSKKGWHDVGRVEHGRVTSPCGKQREEDEGEIRGKRKRDDE